MRCSIILIHLRNRVTQLGVAEPVVQRQGADLYPSLNCRVFRTLRVRKRILGATATLEFRLVRPTLTRLLRYPVVYRATLTWIIPAKVSQLCCTNAGLTGDHITIHLQSGTNTTSSGWHRR
ncbi:hypothetical protein ACNKHV_02070 [Shigella flexneri]